MGTGVSIYNTIRTIVGVHIKSSQQVLNNDGNPIQERFEFTARDLDGDVTSSSLTNNFRSSIIEEKQNDNNKNTTRLNTNSNGIIIGKK